MQRFPEAEAVLRAGLEVDNPVVVSDAWAALADHFIAVDDIRAASDAYEKSLELLAEPSVAQKLALADVLARSGQDARALEAAKDLENDSYRGLIEARVYLNEHEPGEA